MVDTGVQMIFKANTAYWGIVPKTEELNCQFADTNAGQNALTAGQIDMAANFDSTLVGLIAGCLATKIFDYPTSGALSWGMNCEKERLLPTRLYIKNLASCCKRQEIIDNVCSG